MATSRTAADSRTRRPARLAVELVALALATVVLLVPALHLWDADLDVPWEYGNVDRSPLVYAGDAPFYLMISQGMIEHGTYLENSALGAPFGQQLYDLPHGLDNLNLAVIGTLGFVTGDAASAINLFYLLTFVCVALVAYLALRALAISRGVAFVLALLYAFAPYHFARGTAHILLSAYFMVPLAVLIVVRVMSPRPPFFATEDTSVSDDQPTGASGLQVRTHRPVLDIAVVLACLGLASTGAYYAIMTLVIVGAVAVLAALARRSWVPLLSAVIVGAVIVGMSAINLAPSFIYWIQHGRAAEVSERYPGETEINGLKITSLLIPAPGHRLFPDVDDRSRDDSRVPSERGQNLGLIAALGLVAILGAALLAAIGPRRRSRGPDATPLGWQESDEPPQPPIDVMRHLGVMAIAGVGIATVGGISLLLAAAALSEIRSWNRVSIYLAFAGLVAIGYGLDRAIAWTHGRGWPRAIVPIGLVAVLAFGLFDQVTPLAVPAYAQAANTWRSEKAFVEQIADELGPDASVFELPYVTFPEAGATFAAGPYDHVRGFLHAPQLDWSWGEIRGRRPNWQARATGLPPRRQLDAIAAAGFDGILIDRDAYPDQGELIEFAFARELDEQPQVSSDGTLSFFDIRAYAAQLEDDLGPDAFAELRDNTLAAQD